MISGKTKTRTHRMYYPTSQIKYHILIKENYMKPLKNILKNNNDIKDRRNVIR